MKGDERIRTAVPAPSEETAYEWHHALNLSCGHAIDLGTTGHDWRDSDYHKPPLRADGWPAARRCPEGCGRRRVLSIAHRTGGAA